MNRKVLSGIEEIICSLPTSKTALILIWIYTFLGISLITPELRVYFEKWENAILISLFTVMIYRFLISFVKIKKDDPVNPGMCHDQESLPEKIFDRYAIHEAGHYISFALYERKPDILTVYVNPFHCNSSNGCVFFKYKDSPSNKKHFENLMFTYLAGSCAEFILLGQIKNGSSNDNIDWERTAKHYLNSFNTDYPWFTDPQNSSEALVNNQTLDNLRKKQWKEVKRFIENNIQTIELLAKEIKTSKTNKIETGRGLDILSHVITEV